MAEASAVFVQPEPSEEPLEFCHLLGAIEMIPTHRDSLTMDLSDHPNAPPTNSRRSRSEMGVASEPQVCSEFGRTKGFARKEPGEPGEPGGWWRRERVLGPLIFLGDPPLGFGQVARARTRPP